jgi:DNA-directed RNA polymerase specialized sigma24 family protein
MKSSAFAGPRGPAGLCRGMNVIVPMSKSPDLKVHAIAVFLGRLDADPARAREKYEEHRRRLIRIIAAQPRPGGSAEDIADEAIDKVASRMEAGGNIQDVAAYLTVVALNLIKELFRQPHLDQLDDWRSETLVSPENDPREKEVERTCYIECLAKLNAKDRKLLRDFYAHIEEGKHDKAHKESVARQYGKNLPSLRVTISRLQKKLRACKQECMLREKSKLL